MKQPRGPLHTNLNLTLRCLLQNSAMKLDRE